MTHQQILEKAIQKAIEGGWDYLTFIEWNKTWKQPTNPVAQVMAEFYETHGEADPTFELDLVPCLIFNHDFAKALWGDVPTRLTITWLKPKQMTHTPRMPAPKITDIAPKPGIGAPLPSWHYHLQQMVIADDPIKYLGDNL